MLTEVNPPPWMLWTAVALCASAVLGLIAGGWRAARRRYPTVTPTLIFQPLPSSAHLPVPIPGSSRSALPPGVMPAPAPLAPALGAGQTEQRADYRRVGNPARVLVADAD